MASIPGWAYLIIGLLMSGVSKFNPNKEQGFFQIFFVIGLAFILIGVVKIVFSSKKTKKQVVPNQAVNPHILKQQKLQAQQQAHAQRQAQTQQQSNIILCPRCRSQNYRNAKYCQMCGYRLN